MCRNHESLIFLYVASSQFTTAMLLSPSLLSVNLFKASSTTTVNVMMRLNLLKKGIYNIQQDIAQLSASLLRNG